MMRCRSENSMKEGLRSQKGFSLFELLIVLGIVVLLVAVAVPTLMSNVPRYRLKAAARTLVNDLQLAKVEAVKRNCTVEVQVVPGAYDAGGQIGGYRLVELTGNTVLLSRRMPQYVTLYTTNLAANKTGYNSQGLPSTMGSIFLRNNKSTFYAASVSIAGNVSLSISTTDPS